MLISLGVILRDGPWGGGNQFAHGLSSYLKAHDHEVCFDLHPPNIDIILLFDPRPNSQSASYQVKDIFKYLSKFPQTLVVHRINECDERKNTQGVNACLVNSNKCADQTVFVSKWIRDLYVSQYSMPSASHSVILNGSDRRLFNLDGKNIWDNETPLKIVSHHWGKHPNKGFAVYALLDELIGGTLKGKVEFTFIGNLPEGMELKNSTYVPPVAGRELADMLKQQHVYITASRNEPGSNHQNEGANCGLPLLYLDSGPMKEYCEGFGISYEPESLYENILKMMEQHEYFSKRMKFFPHHGDRMCGEYYSLFCQLLDNRDWFISRRKRLRRQSWLFHNFFQNKYIRGKKHG